VKANRPELISLPVGKVYAIKTFVLLDGWFKAKKLIHDDPFPISSQSGKFYSLDVEVEKDEIGRNYFVGNGEKMKVIERAPAPKNCQYQYDWVHYQ